MYYAPEITTPLGPMCGFDLLDPKLDQVWSLGVPIVDDVVQMGISKKGAELFDYTRLAVCRDHQGVLIYREDNKYLQVRNRHLKGSENDQLMFPISVPFVWFVESSTKAGEWDCAYIEAESDGQLAAMKEFAALVGSYAVSKQAKYLYNNPHLFN